jgi:CBS domain-containing protein
LRISGHAAARVEPTSSSTSSIASRTATAPGARPRRETLSYQGGCVIARSLRRVRPFARTALRVANDENTRQGVRMHHEHKKVRDVMTANPRTIEPSTPILEAARLMRDQDVGPLPIVDGGRVVGILTDRDIDHRVGAYGTDPPATTASKVASKQLVTIDPEQMLDEAARLMAQHQVRRLPVCEEDGRLVGIVAQADVAIAASDQETGRVVEEISK